MLPPPHDGGVTAVHELTYETCDKLIRAGVFGRMVLSRSTGPEIVPVNYVVVGDTVLVRTSPGSLLDQYADGADLVFEVDHADYTRWHGWSVVARGRGERVAPDELTDEERTAPGPPAWITREEVSWIRLPWVTLTGRKVGNGWDPLSDLPVRRWR